MTRIAVEDDDIVYYTTEPPTSGRANDSLVKYFSKLFNVPRKDVVIVRGRRERLKVVRIYGIAVTEVLVKLREMNQR